MSYYDLVHGDWGGWSTWGTCSSTCGIGLRRRDRACDSPWPSSDGNHCFGDSVDQDICMDFQCKLYHIISHKQVHIFRQFTIVGRLKETKH